MSWRKGRAAEFPWNSWDALRTELAVLVENSLALLPFTGREPCGWTAPMTHRRVSKFM
ncbi:hypothetical protein DFR24_0664 [Panacagrimonas perspica]|uniref:Uncharacterized protein n=1 Tax=Panacagrimonas perspica TaxID=381431 RepID=A0A4R7PDE9_9GAMM|nr:hypothetical protein [Panacagrimonas perspica]TDU31300.1 hypothetical protein DFR24_0664 [Panacagrimonas perspica]